MADNIMVTINVAETTTLYVTADVYANSTQEVQIVPQSPLILETMAASGSGWATRINNWGIELVSAGSYRFALQFQYDPGAQPSTTLNQAALATGTPSSTLNQVVVTSQNGTNDGDCCIITFSWFSSADAASTD